MELINYPEQRFGKKIKPAIREELKKLWRQLAFKFHPDLVIGDEEKANREKMMKRINEAYARGDIATLRTVSEEGDPEEEYNSSDITMQELERGLMDTEACIRRMRQKLLAFKRSEWYAWKEGIEKAKKKKQDFFAIHEKNTRKSVKEKEKELAKLQEVIDTFK